jgi:hypothetical protein
MVWGSEPAAGPMAIAWIQFTSRPFAALPFCDHVSPASTLFRTPPLFIAAYTTFGSAESTARPSTPSHVQGEMLLSRRPVEPAVQAAKILPVVPHQRRTGPGTFT